MKAAAIIADWVTSLTEVLDDFDRLVAVLNRIGEVLLKSGARVQNRNVHPSLFPTPASPYTSGLQPLS